MPISTRVAAGTLLVGAVIVIGGAEQSRPTKVSVEQLTKSIIDRASHSDSDTAQQIAGMELVERIGRVELARLVATLPGEKSRTALMLVADKAVYLDPPANAIGTEPIPDAVATRAMLVKVVNYVNSTNRQLPNLMAERATTGFEDRPQEDALEATGTVGYSYQPLHWVGRSTVIVTYRDRKEVVDEKAGKERKEGAGIGGLVTSGEFGPILSVVIGDALKGKITWARWERWSSAPVAVFHYDVPEEKSNYRVQFCCLVGGYNGDGTPQLEKFDERAGYHGEIAFNPSNGSVLRLTATTEMPAGGLVPHAGFAIDYGPVEIGGREYICPLNAAATLQAHTMRQPAAFSKSAYQGAAKTFLNDIAFSNYRRFGSEMRMLPASNR